ncbi:probable LRR receptor-like serine/threonine-protein kinase At3g47570 [Mercurialis annua]|uniref:probable LRR receptor-like serine/threonine-protein kinase At3g47570 n=1 Tax=Mercurialis annua TaxID=3986 RepID=UPI00215E7A19|nr:probable LRR receptor-like serine/threonine-protein kinase At3g47570 [Mercurialis annua]
MGHNLFHGTIPFSIGNLQNIRILVLEDNRLSGQIPSSIGNLSNLYQISIAQNKLEGNIPVSITNCQNLQYLDISDNNLNGTIPDDIFRISSLSLLLNLSRNSFTGNLSWDISKLININKLDISGNKLSGEISETIGACVSLEFLYLQENSFQGIIPASLNSLKGLQELDLSRNHLTGEIPKDLQSLDSLKYLNLSYNNLAGQIPTEGVFSNLSAVFLTGNNNLCGGLTELQQPECRTKRKSNSSAAILAIIIVTSVIISVMLAIAVALVYLRGRKLKTTSLSAEPEEIGGLMSVSYTDLYNTTNGFSGDNLIGSGSFGSVYKGYLTQMERHVAIKVLKLETNGAAKSLTAECKVLSSVRHRNLVKLLTYCSSIDYKGNEFKALVYELMDNGSLEKWLHQDDLFVKLNFLRRLNIAIDVASALHYLHDLCENPIVHCDLKPSNVLLDDDMVAHLGDFGLAKLFLSVDGVSQGQTTSSVGIRGTIGYTPPEYGMSGTTSKEGDVYSYGILVLELFTGKRPTDQIFEGHTNLHNYVKNSLPNDAEKVMDPALLLSKEKKEKSVLTVTKKEDENCLMSSQVDDDDEEEETDRLCRLNYDKVRECLVSVFKVGVGCSNESPHERMYMGDVVKELHFIRSHFVGVRIYG